VSWGLVLGVIELLVATVEGNGLISILSGCSLAAFCSRDHWVCLCWWLLFAFQLLLGCSLPTEKVAEFPSAGAMTNALPEQNLRAGLEESCMALANSWS